MLICEEKSRQHVRLLCNYNERLMALAEPLPMQLSIGVQDKIYSRAPRHTENPYCEMVTPLRPFVVQDPSLFSRLPGHKRVSISVSKEMEFLGMPGCPGLGRYARPKSVQTGITEVTDMLATFLESPNDHYFDLS
jgi:hypothetical protein